MDIGGRVDLVQDSLRGRLEGRSAGEFTDQRFFDPASADGTAANPTQRHPHPVAAAAWIQRYQRRCPADGEVA